MMVQAAKHRTERSFAVGDWVFVKLHPYRQLSFKDHSFQKLSSKFYGPFQVTAKLKQRLGSHIASTTLPEVHSDSGHILVASEAILDRRQAQRRGKAITQVLVKWLNSAPEDSTWEELQDFSRKFPHFNP
ncbi:uncharacterized protein LOC132069379 [Lycium ferocissimum]|uniref:uncharacterized protein LOC132069379 n=1 Tax=Lycium ferocissimum TaxID=112874 RepID=UPI0028168BD4|nr:uncharacterized protein LOC132069379 [Lycium ferocissimum]